MKYAFLFLSVFLFAGCTKQMADDAIELLPGVGEDKEITVAVNSQDATRCRHLEGKDEPATRNRQLKCLEAVAVAAQNEEFCIDMMNYYNNHEQDRDVFEKVERCVTKVAKDKKEIAICERLDSLGDREIAYCYAEVVPILGDASLCAKIYDQMIWEDCISDTAKSSQNFETCSNLKDVGARARCQWEVAALRSDEGLCGKVEREDFRNNCYRDLARKTGNAGLCDEITHDGNREKCKAENGQKQ